LKIGIGGFPPETDAAEIRRAVEEFGVPVNEVTVEASPDPTRYRALIDADVDEAGARVLVDKIDGRVWRGKPLRAERYLMFE
jgi:hypothetical protein